MAARADAVREETRFAVAQIAEDAGRRNSVQVPARLVEIFVELAETYADRVVADVCHFAKHARRTTVAAEDVLLCVRHSETATEALNAVAARERGGG
jgi:histone H3/H4